MLSDPDTARPLLLLLLLLLRLDIAFVSFTPDSAAAAYSAALERDVTVLGRRDGAVTGDSVPCC